MTKETKELSFTYFKDTEEKKPEWLWEGHILKGATHVLGGKQGTSKGLFTVDIAARLSRGDLMPDGTGEGEVKKVLFVTREDSPEMALKRRLREAGADMNNIAWTYGDFSDGKPIRNMEEGAKYIEKVVNSENIDLVFIDPIGAWIEDDANNSQSVRAVIDPMNAMSRSTGCSVLFVAHIRKGNRPDDAMDAFAGSTQMTAAVRLAMLISPTADGKERLLEVVKTNFRRPKKSMIYEVIENNEDPDVPPTLLWRESTERDRSDMAIANKKGAAPVIHGDDIIEFIPAKHLRWNAVKSSVHKKLVARNGFDKATQKGVEDAMNELLSEGRVKDGKYGNARTIGIEDPPLSKEDSAIEIFLSFPDISIREGADKCGCSIGIAQKSKKKAEAIRKTEESSSAEVFSESVQSSEIEVVNTEHEGEQSELSVRSLSPPLI
jgi:hypothetical protein